LISVSAVDCANELAAIALSGSRTASAMTSADHLLLRQWGLLTSKQKTSSQRFQRFGEFAEFTSIQKKCASRER
jgi:hypothetical protein